MEETRGDLVISTDPARLDMDVVHGYLSGESYWARGVPRDQLERALAHSLCFGVYRSGRLGRLGRQIGFGRVVTDRATFAYLADVFLLEAERGGGLGRWLIETIHRHPDLQGLRRWLLCTRDAHEFYERLGWRRADQPQIFMEMLRGSGSAEPP